MKKYIAIDSSTNSLAFASFAGETLLKFGILKFSGNGIYDKIPDIASKTGALFAGIDAEHIVIESTFFALNPKVTTDLALAQGAILGAASGQGVKYIAGVPPMNWQRYIGNGPYQSRESRYCFRESWQVCIMV